MDFGVAVVFAGQAPADGVSTHEGKPLFTYGANGDLVELLHGKLHLLDVVVPLEATADGEPAWLVLRRHSTSKGATVLIVEDNDVNREFYAEVLDQLGLHVHTAADAASAIEIARTHDLDIALVDVRLPDANGFELCRSLLAESGIDRCTMILMSADPGLADTDRVLAAGAIDFIVNPIAPKQLARRVSAALEHSMPKGRTLSAEGTSAPTSDAVATRLRFFGRPAVEVNGRWIPLRAGRAADLMATLAAACPTPVSSDRLARFAWPVASDVSPNAVYTAMSRLRQFLADIGVPDLVVTDGSGYFLDLEPNNIDLVHFEESARQLLAEPASNTPERVQAVLDQCTGLPFAGTKNAVLERWANRLAEARSRLLEALALTLAIQGQAPGAAAVCRDLLHDEPWRESMWALLIASLYRAGRTNDALHTYSEATERLRGELGLDPGPKLANLEVMVLTHDPLLLDDNWLLAASGGGPLPR